jgi:hypothetical protein
LSREHLPSNAANAATTQTACSKASHVERICNQVMQQPPGKIPVSCDYVLADRWYKATTSMTDKEGKLIPWRQA